MTLRRQEIPHEYAPVVMRAMRNSDLFQCFKIDRQAYPDPERWDEATWHDVMGTLPAAVAVQGANVVAFAIYSLAAESVAILKFAVHPRCQRCGIGTLLAGRVVETCREHARKFVEVGIPLDTLPHHLGAMAFLKFLGWHGHLAPGFLQTPELVRFVKENRRK